MVLLALDSLAVVEAGEVQIPVVQNHLAAQNSGVDNNSAVAAAEKPGSASEPAAVVAEQCLHLKDFLPYFLGGSVAEPPTVPLRH